MGDISSLEMLNQSCTRHTALYLHSANMGSGIEIVDLASRLAAFTEPT